MREQDIRDYTINGVCSNCGACCSNTLPLTDREIQTIRRYIRRNHIREQKHFVPMAGPVLDLTCPFRDNGTNTCTIYSVRPAVCRDFRCNKSLEEMREATASYREALRQVNVRQTFFGGAQHD